MQETPNNPIARLSRQHEYLWAHSWYVADDGRWQTIVDVANDFPDVNPFSQDPRDTAIAFRHLGLVKVSMSNREICVTWDLVHADLKALESTIAFLFNHRDQHKTRLRFFHAGWCEEIFSFPAQAMRRVIQLQAFRGKDPELGIFMRQHAPEEAEAKSRLLGNCIENWNREAATLNLNNMAARSLILPNSQILSQNKKGDYHFLHIGGKTMIANMFGERWRQSVIGTCINDAHADREFEESVCAPYEEALYSRQPYYDHIRALVIRRAADPIWISYQRLILPYLTSDGHQTIGIFVVPDQNVSIPLFNSPTLGQSTGSGPAI